MNVVTPTHRWRDTVLATIVAIVFVLFALSGMLVHALAAVWAAAVTLGIISRWQLTDRPARQELLPAARARGAQILQSSGGLRRE